MISSRATIALLTGLLVCSLAFGATSALERDTEIQAKISAVVAAVTEQPDTVEARVQELQHAADGRREAVLVQLALFLSDSDSTEEAMVGASLLHGLGFTAQEKLDAVLPHLETEPASLRKVMAEILGTVDIGFYEQVIGEQGRERYAALIRYLYRTSPPAALAAMTRVFGDGRAVPDTSALDALVAKHDGLLPWSDGERADAEGMLDRLSGNPAWWVRLYAAAVVQQQPELMTAAHRARPESDPDALVRSFAREVGASR